MAEGHTTGIKLPAGLGKGNDAAAPGLNARTAQSEGTAGTETTTKATGDGKTVAAVDESKVTRVREQGNAASLRNDPPPMVNGVSGSLVQETELRDAENDELSTQAKLQQSIATQDAANRGIQLDAQGTQYSSHPVANFRIGRFQFNKGLLRLDDKDSADFDQLLEKLPVTERAKIRKLDVAAAEAIVRQRLETGAGRTTKNFDSSTGERPDPLGPTVGTVELGFENRAQQDMNAPVIPSPVLDPTGETGLDYGAHTEESAREAADENK